MRRAVAATVVTAIAVAWLASYRTHPPRRDDPRVQATATPTPSPTPRASGTRPGTPGTRTGVGPAISTPFSVVQVEATLTGRRLTGVRTLALSGNDSHTQALNARAEPILRREALRAGSADIDTVSGATATSESWIDSLNAAIEDARG